MKTNATFSLPAFAVSKAVIWDQNENVLFKTLLYGLDSLDETHNKSILNATIEFLI